MKYLNETSRKLPAPGEILPQPDVPLLEETTFHKNRPKIDTKQ